MPFLQYNNDLVNCSTISLNRFNCSFKLSMVEGNEEVARFLVTKHSIWKGKYKRILSIGSLAVCTLSPQTLEITNAWPYNEVTNVLPSPKANNEFALHLRKGKKSDKMNFFR